jgi:AcrR family transcriptional regulator
MTSLPIFGEPPAERADAARNRRRILDAAARLIGERGVEAVSMDDIAIAAGVGKGTLYRRFGDKAGLGVAILDARERDLQEAILRGRPPLGPGGPPRERLHAFVDAYLDYLDRNLDLVLMCETAGPGARYRSGVYAGWRRHVEVLFGSSSVQDPGLRADVLLAALGADLHAYQGGGSPAGTEAIRQIVHDLVDCLALGKL